MYKFDNDAKLIASLYFSFCGFMVVWGQHYHFASAVVLSIFVLWMFERWLQDKKYLGFTASLSLLMALDIYAT